MVDELKKAKAFAAQFRYSDDRPTDEEANDVSALSAVRGYFYENGLRISRQVTPNLGAQFENVCRRLKLPETSVEAFVYPSPEIQAACASDGANACVIRFSSALIETLSDEEFEFVAGHELGHFLLGHRKTADEQSLEHYMFSRAAEISADRIGLVACQSLDASVRAMMKTVSGLTSRHLRFDVGTFIAQIKEKTSNDGVYASHPSMLVRCRSLLWFSTGTDIRSEEVLSAENRVTLDKRIDDDFKRYVDGEARERIEQAKKNLSMWLVVRQIVDRFSKDEQEKFANLYGREKLESLKNYLQSISPAEIHKSVDKRIADAREKLVSMIPLASAKEIEKIEKFVREQLA